MSITVEQALAVAQAVVEIVVKAAPAIEKGVISAAPYVSAIAGMLTGSNATQEQIDALLAQLEIDSADFQTPLPPEDGV